VVLIAESRSLWRVWTKSILVWLLVLTSFVSLMTVLEQVSVVTSIRVLFAIGLPLLAVLIQQTLWFVIEPKFDEHPSRSKSDQKPRSCTLPFRSPLLSVIIKLVCIIGIVAAVYVPLRYPIANTFIPLAVLPLMFLMSYAYKLGIRPLRLTSSTRSEAQPVVFLRSFADDDSVSLQPSGLSGFLQGSRGWRRNRRININFLSKLTADYVAFQPIRFIRLLFQIPMDTSEEILAKYFHGFGPVIAIGRPGEALATGGAARLYVPDNEWKGIVRFQLYSCQAVVLQPSTSDGIWWEVASAIEHVPHERKIGRAHV